VTDTALQLKPIPQYTERGIPLLRKIWDAILADESAWNQGTWIGTACDEDGVPDRLTPQVIDYIQTNQVPPWNCGTAYCVAGHAALATGAKLTPYQVAAVERRYLETDTVVVNGQEWPVEDYAADVLDLDGSQASVLFAGHNTKEVITALVEALEADPCADLYAVREDYWAEHDEA
jgi:hypothetical protein